MTARLGDGVRLSALAVDPYPILAQLREHEPVAWVGDARMWFVTRRDDVLAVLRDTETYRVDSPSSTIRDTFGEHMLSTEGERQRRYKSQCAAPFNTRAVREHAMPHVAATVTALVDRIARDGRADLRPGLASPLAVDTVCAVLGIPATMHETVRHWYDDFAAALANFTWDPAVRARGRASADAFRAAVAPLVNELARVHDPSLLGTLGAHAERLSDEEILSNALIVLFGGIETTESTLLNVLWALLTHRNALAAVRADGALLENAIEEAMRWEPAVQSCTRHVERETVLRGVTLAPGETVQCMLGAANRDPAYFADPDVFDIRRSNAGDHVSFGSGRHFCLGAALARAEVRTSIGELLARFAALRLERSEGPYGYEFRAPRELVVIAEN